MNSSGGWVYILHGDDVVARDDAVRSLKGRMRALPAGEHNLTVISEGEASVAALRAAADSLPFLADRRMVVVSGLLGKLQGVGAGSGRGARRGAKGASRSAGTADETAALLAYLHDVPFTTSIAFVEAGKVDVAPIQKAIPEGRGHVMPFPRPEGFGMTEWVRKRARTRRVDLDESAVRELAQLGADDLRRIDTEIRKLACYVADGEPVTREDVRALVVGRETLTWALLDALAARNLAQALSALRRLYLQGEEPMKLLGADVAPLYRRLLVARELGSLPRNERSSMESAFGVNPRALPKQMEQAAAFSVAEIERALELLLALDRGVKTGELEVEAALELTVAHLCSRL
ncbi:MAG: DNA polymerase III subunit delta [Chloroflexi bacterium]|nr:DNA polymerase III subunit delta [Chloroflexota bacterium]